jgi:trk system potassium uptake protein TrkA
MVRMIDPKFEEIYKTAGVTNIARGLEFVINQIFINIESPELRGVITLGDIEMCIYNIPENAKCAGQTIA